MIAQSQSLNTDQGNFDGKSDRSDAVNALLPELSQFLNTDQGNSDRSAYAP
jgi:hypothetical protein